MTLPPFNEHGDLPEGVYRASLEEVPARFGRGTAQRRAASERLRFVVFGSYVTANPSPNDVDIILVMADDFDAAGCDEQTRTLFDHLLAQREFGASVFAVRPSTVLLETVDEFIGYWQVKRDKSRRGIVELIWEPER